MLTPVGCGQAVEYSTLHAVSVPAYVLSLEDGLMDALKEMLMLLMLKQELHTE